MIPARRRKKVWVGALLLVAGSQQLFAQNPFTVKDEIEFAHFGDPWNDSSQPFSISPDGRYLAVMIERGNMRLDRPEGTMRIYSMAAIREGFKRRDRGRETDPEWEFHRSAFKDGPVISQWRWLADSGGIAFLERGGNGVPRLMLASLRARSVETLSTEGEAVTGFDILSRTNYVYSVSSGRLKERARAEHEAAAIVASGRSLLELLFPPDETPVPPKYNDRHELRAVIDGRHVKVRDRATGGEIVLNNPGWYRLALAPKGGLVIAVVPVSHVPSEWEARYPPPGATDASRVRAGYQDISASVDQNFISQYVRIDLRTGSVEPIAGAPCCDQTGWWALENQPQWSSDGRAALLPNTFGSFREGVIGRPCLAVRDLASRILSCLEPIMRPGSHQYRLVTSARFADGDHRRVSILYREQDGSTSKAVFRRLQSGIWKKNRVGGGGDPSEHDVEVFVRESVNEPPVLMATDTRNHISSIVWNPNPQLREVELGEVTVFRWKDKSGREWSGGLYMPPGQDRQRRYPLVIQTHGFFENRFEPSGLYPTAFAARALAALGMVVLQVPDCPVKGNTEEAMCNVMGYEAAAQALAEAGRIDLQRVGIVGFSRSCYYTMAAITKSSLRFAAAVIADGVMADYVQYITTFGYNNDVLRDAENVIGAPPFGQGLERWMARSPLWNLEKASTPLLVFAHGRFGLTQMWAPYAVMRSLGRPVELLMLNNEEHVLSNPSARLASQGTSVDWFGFWLMGKEDPGPEKKDQYARWSQMAEEWKGRPLDAQPKPSKETQ